MTSPAILMLLERLLWPIPRVRWETARSLARLIREEDGESANSLLNWISARRLESEAVLGLGIIDAFDLSAFFKFEEVSQAVRAPSHLSDLLLKKNFPNANGLSPFRYAISPPEPSTLTVGERSWFDRYRKAAVPPMFSGELKRLQQMTGIPFRARWEHDWRWLQATHPRPEPDPHFFSGVDRERIGQFDLGQRELYVSAFLRTLAYYAVSGAISHEIAEHFSLLSLTMNRGLANLEPIPRPVWARNLLPCEAGRTKKLTQKLWACVEAAARPGEVPIALRVVDLDTQNFVEFDLTLAVGPINFTSRTPEVETHSKFIENKRPGEMEGLVSRNANFDWFSLDYPLAMTEVILLKDLGRVHIDMACNIRLASPDVFGTSANVKCSPTDIRLEAGGDVVSRWVHWYADWEPTVFRELHSTVGSMTTVLKSSLEKLRASRGMEIARLVRVHRGTRREIYEKHKVETEAYWI